MLEAGVGGCLRLEVEALLRTDVTSDLRDCMEAVFAITELLREVTEDVTLAWLTLVEDCLSKVLDAAGLACFSTDLETEAVDRVIGALGTRAFVLDLRSVLIEDFLAAATLLCFLAAWIDDFFTAIESFLEGVSMTSAATDDFLQAIESFLEAQVVATSEATLAAAVD